MKRGGLRFANDNEDLSK